MKTTLTALALTGTVAVAALMGGIGDAEAGGKKHFKHHHWNHHHHHRPHFFGHHRHGCGFYKVRWHQTGKFYWKKKYFICKGWW